VKVIPRARTSEIVEWKDGVLKIRLHAIPEKGEANEALIEFLADQLDISKSSITLIRGSASRIKHLQIDGITESEFLDKLQI
jgi:uncharacterized protein